MIGLLTSDLHYGFNSKADKTISKFIPRIAKGEWDFMIIAGDIISDSQSQFYDICQLLRKSINKPIYIVYGNHDYWGKWAPAFGESTLDQWYKDLHKYKREVCEKFDIHYLQDNPYVHDDFVILGLDGWYGHPNPPTRDAFRMPDRVGDVMSFMRGKADKCMDFIMEYDYDNDKKVIIVNHFQTFPDYKNMWGYQKDFTGPTSWHPFLTDLADVYCVGHSHTGHKFNENNCLVLNGGSDYGNPSYKLFHI